MELIKYSNLAVAFLLELAMLAAYGVWAASLQQSTIVRSAVGAGAIVLVIVLWGVLAAPNSTTRLGQPWLTVFQLVIFGLAALALHRANHDSWAATLLAVWAVSTALSLAWRQ